MYGHLGVQLASYMLSRATIQTAVIMATGLGSRHKSASGMRRSLDNTYRHAACELQLGALQIAPPLLGIQLIEVYETQLNSPWKKKFTRWFSQNDLRCFEGRDDLLVDLVLTPIDGAESLRNGESGSVSVAAAAPRGTAKKKSFCNPCEGATGYLAIAVSAQHAKSIKLHDKDLAFSAKTLTDLQEDFPLLQRIINQSPVQEHPVLAEMFAPYPQFEPILPVVHCIRRLEGSSVAAALAAFCGKVPYSIFFSRIAQIMQIAVAACGLKGQLYAIPLYDPKDRMAKSVSNHGQKSATNSNSTDKANYDHVEIVTPTVFRESDFVKASNAIFTCTSISEVCVLDRVRFIEEGIAVTDTINVSLVSGRMSRQNDHLPQNWMMRGPDGKELMGRNLIDAFNRYLLKNDQKASIAAELNQ